MKHVVAILLLCAVAVTSQKCKCQPKQYSAMMGALIGQVTNGHTQSMRAVGTFAVDYGKGRQGGTQKITGSGFTIVQRYVIDLVEHLGYFVTAGKCTKVPVPTVADPCLTGAHYEGTYSYGTKGNFVFEAFSLTIPPSKKFNGTIEAHAGLDRESCVPFQSTTIAKMTTGGFTLQQMMTINLVNATLGLPDPSVLNIPSECLPDIDLVKSKKVKGVY